MSLKIPDKATGSYNYCTYKALRSLNKETESRFREAMPVDSLIIYLNNIYTYLKYIYTKNIFPSHQRTEIIKKI
jgi:hypothetical protein